MSGLSKRAPSRPSPSRFLRDRPWTRPKWVLEPSLPSAKLTLKLADYTGAPERGSCWFVWYILVAGSVYGRGAGTLVRFRVWRTSRPPIVQFCKSKLGNLWNACIWLSSEPPSAIGRRCSSSAMCGGGARSDVLCGRGSMYLHACMCVWVE